MTSSTTFRPKHSHPFTLEEAMLLEINILVAEVARLQNSILHLQETQSELRSYLLEEQEDGDEDGEIGLAIEENETTISSQTERIELIKLALTNKVGADAIEHYGLAINPVDTKTDVKESQSLEGGETGGTGVDASEEGIHL